MGTPEKKFPRIKCVITVGDETSVLWTTPLSMYRAEKALGHSVLHGMQEMEYSAVAALCYSVTAGASAEFLKANSGSHVKALEAWLALEPDFSVDINPEEEDDNPPDDPGSSGSS